MTNKFSTIALATLLGLSTVAVSGASASAAAMLPLSSATSGDAHGVQGGIIQVDQKNKKWKKNKWENRRFNNYCNYEYGGCGNFYPRRYRYHAPYWSAPLIIGGGFGGYNYYNDYYDGYDDYDGGGLSSRHVRYCLNKYRSYNPRYNTWVAYSGQVRKCYSPYL
jgi:hypothetical protein